MGDKNHYISVTDQEGKTYFGKIKGMLDAEFLDGANYQSNKPYLKAVKQIIDQTRPEEIELEDIDK